MYTFPVSQLLTTGATFTTGANEKYTVKSDGIFLTIECVRPSYPDGPLTSGHNIDSVRLDLPDGRSFFAGEIISVTFGEDAIRGSEKNILGPTDGEIAVLGDIFSSITVGFIKEVPPKPPIDTEKNKEENRRGDRRKREDQR